jgi:hypothetical protein
VVELHSSRVCQGLSVAVRWRELDVVRRGLLARDRDEVWRSGSDVESTERGGDAARDEESTVLGKAVGIGYTVVDDCFRRKRNKSWSGAATDGSVEKLSSDSGDANGFRRIVCVRVDTLPRPWLI